MIAASEIPGELPFVERESPNHGAHQWDDAQLALACIAVDPVGLGGVRLRAASGPVRDVWTRQLSALLPKNAPKVKLPVGADSDRILGGLDLAAALRAGRPISEAGLLASADGGGLFVSMAERLPPASAALIAAAMDSGFISVERSGVSRRDGARFFCIAFDEGCDETEAPPQVLLDRLAFHISLGSVSINETEQTNICCDTIVAARKNLESVSLSEKIGGAIASAGAELGVHSLRALIFAIRAARASAALNARKEVTQSDAAIACRLVFGPRTVFDTPIPPEPAERDNQRNAADDADISDEQSDHEQKLEEMLVATARAAALGWLLKAPASGTRRRGAPGAGGKSGALIESTRKGRPFGARAGLPRDGARLDLSATLRAAAPWRKMRDVRAGAVLLPIYKDDLRIKRFKARAETLVIFVVDASGSSAMHRMAEAKGAVELLLSDCYSRRDHVALIAFRGEKADLLLPPTRSLTRVRRTLGAMPGGGGTPLASGVAAAAILAETEKRKGKTPFVVILSDGRGNIALNGNADRAAAQADAVSAGRRLRAAECAVLFFDISNRPSTRAKELSDEIGARYTPLPYSDSEFVSKSVKQAIASG